MLIKIDQINADGDFNSRGKILPIDVADLARDIEREGLLQPVIIMNYPEPVEGKLYHLVAGFRRFTAHLVLKKEEIDCKLIGDYDEEEARFINLNENLQRKDLTFMQESYAIQAVMDTVEKKHGGNATERRVMDKLGASRGWVQVRMMAVKLPEDIQKELRDNDFANQQDIRDLYSVFLSGNKEALIELVKSMKDLKLRKVVTKRKEVKHKKDQKRHRQRHDIFQVQDHIRENMGNNIITRTLAWCAGEVSNQEFDNDVKEYAEDNGLPYNRLELI